ncbi:exo-alpha-sialidase [Allorhodopirellula solitaria]|nr:exo-alpha-sialidase [Allorhodopirellula solitaria]
MRTLYSFPASLLGIAFCIISPVGRNSIGVALGESVERPVSTATTSFEDAKPGQFEKFETGVGTWTSDAGVAIVDATHASTGRQCLRLTGDQKTVVTLQLNDAVDSSGALSFRAERWTSRPPFEFRIEKNSGDGWEEIHNGDTTVRVGRAFLSQVIVPLNDDQIEQLRITCASPPNTGILIDDIRIAAAEQQKITRVEAVPFTLPVLVGAPASPLAKLKIDTTGILNPISVTEVRARIEGIEQIESLQVAGGDSVATAGLSETAATQLGVSRELNEGENIVWVRCQLKADADIDQQVGASVEQVTFSNKETVKLDSPISRQRMGVALRQRGDDGAHTYRIPGLATTNEGTLIGVYDIRRRRGSDLPGDIDVGMSRSTDGGRTWEPMKAILNMGDDPEWRYDGVGDPAVLVDRNTNTVWVAGTWSHGDRAWHGSGPGLAPEETGQLMLVRSDDDGVTWSKPINITEQVKRPEWSFILQGPGKGITMRDGTIVFAAQYQDSPQQQRLPHSTIIYSEDHGTTWQAGTGALDDTTEAQVIELEPGVLMLNCRYNRKSARAVMITRDMGKTWQQHPTSEIALIEPKTCMASLIDADREVGRDIGGWLLFSNPDSLRGRNHITIKASPDRGMTWPKQQRLLLDEENGAGYSCMSMIDENTVGILYEGSQAHMTFQRVPLSDILAGSSGSDEEHADADVPTDPDSATLQLPRVFGSHMVMQAEAPLPVWGKAAANSNVTVKLGSDTLATTAGGDGEWQVCFAPRNASSAPIVLTVQSGDEQLSLSDVLIGEVWVCAGQSNMEWPLDQSTSGENELAELAGHGNDSIRLLDLTDGPRALPQNYSPGELPRLAPDAFVDGQWSVASVEAAREFSAVAWYFGQYLQDQLNMPVGLICPAVGGSPAESWIPREAMEQDARLKGIVAGNWLRSELLGEFCPMRGQQNLQEAIQAGETVPGDQFGPNHPFKPGFLWSAGIAPLIPYAIRGVVWYQGESNAETPERVRQHELLFPLLVNTWRRQWNQGDFPFLFVQLPAIDRPEWPLFRDGQRRALRQIENVGMAITIDSGHRTDVHPRLKQPVGERLARWAMGTTYASGVHATYSGPLFDTAQRENDSMIVSFTQAGKELRSSDGDTLRYFELCGHDGVFHPAVATTIDRCTISVSSSSVAHPVDVRYAWLPYLDPPVNLVNSKGLPASPFSTQYE